MGNSDHLWGKEHAIALLMREQRARGTVDPVLITFAPGILSSMLAGEGFRTVVLGASTKRFPFKAARRLAEILRATQTRVLHTHSYKANLVGRALRVLGLLPECRLVSTCHGFGLERDRRLRLYNALDRWSTPISHATTVPDPAMLARFPRFCRAVHVPNGVPDLDMAGVPDPGPLLQRTAGEFLAGTLGRVSVEKGIEELLAAARDCPDPSVVFAVAGDGELTETVAAAPANVRYFGYFRDPRAYLASLDVYVQASRSEGLSLALLEAMRAGKPIAATDVGATRMAIVNGESALLVPAGRPDQLLDAVLTLRRDPELAARLGRNARRRFEADFCMDRQHDRFFELYFPAGAEDHDQR
jgi:glycosyltransferase involved in cell wall biosynthesis